MLRIDSPRHPRRPNLTPMIDVVFLLLVFFMLASRFGAENVIPLANGLGQGSAPATLRLVEIEPETLRLNGAQVSLEDLPDDLKRLDDDPRAPVVLRARKARVQRLVVIVQALRAAGLTQLMLVK